MQNSRTCDIAVVGAGPAGMMAAIAAAIPGIRVLVLEKNRIPGVKLNLTGKGRCNVTNNCSAETVIKNTPRNGKFLYSCMNRFPPSMTRAFFEENGVPLKVERGNRVFPVSDRAKDVSDALYRAMKRRGAELQRSRAVELLCGNGRICGVRTEDGPVECKAAILATGGLSYPKTGSTGDGYRMAYSLGHTLVEPRASIVPLESDDPSCGRMQGLSLRNVGVRAYDGTWKLVYEDFGELLFAHFGISGPTVLSMSAHLRDYEKNAYSVSIDLKPALDEKKLDERVLRDFAKYKNRTFKNSLGDLLPARMVDEVVLRSGIDPDKAVNSVTRAERHRLVAVLKDFRIGISSPRPIEEAIVTSGGISVKEIDPQTMRSRLVPGLYFAGEIIDVDSYTGGFNLQIAWSTGYVAGESAACEIGSL
jgi:predicted Rossmann fold flavoprotein